jgi:hypothetical protein
MNNPQLDNELDDDQFDLGDEGTEEQGNGLEVIQEDAMEDADEGQEVEADPDIVPAQAPTRQSKRVADRKRDQLQGTAQQALALNAKEAKPKATRAKKATPTLLNKRSKKAPQTNNDDAPITNRTNRRAPQPHNNDNDDAPVTNRTNRKAPQLDRNFNDAQVNEMSTMVSTLIENSIQVSHILADFLDSFIYPDEANALQDRVTDLCTQGIKKRKFYGDAGDGGGEPETTGRAKRKTTGRGKGKAGRGKGR